MKLWTIKTNECVKTYDQHLNKVSHFTFKPIIFHMTCMYILREITG